MQTPVSGEAFLRLEDDGAWTVLIARRPIFGVVAFTVTVLGMLAFAARLLQPYIEPLKPSPENHLPGETAEYLVQGAAEQLDWRVVGDDAFAEARRLDRPLLIVVGTPWSKLGRGVDQDAFTSPEVQNYMNRNFELIRIDGCQRPDWMNTYLPISRLRYGFLTGFQMWALTPRGQMFDFIARVKPTDQLDHNEILAALITVHRHFQALPQENVVASQQKADLSAIETAPPGSPDVQRYGQILSKTSDPEYGGFPWMGWQFLAPDAWRFQLMTGRDDDYRKSIVPLLSSPLVDLLDGGFYRDASSLDWTAVEYDKVAVQNAGMMAMLAGAGAVADDSLGDAVARQTFDCLANDFMRNGLIAACQVGDEQALERSAHASFSPRTLRAIFPFEDRRDWIRKEFGLDVRENPQATPRITDPSAYLAQSPDYVTGLGALRAYALQNPPELAGFDLLDVNGYVVARMIEAAVLWKDPVRLQKALNIYDRLDQFRSSDDVVHNLSGSSREQGLLSDYLGYADASLQAYLATGRIYNFDSGLAVLNRACFLFAGRVPGEYMMSRSYSNPVWPEETRVPELVDNCGPSCTARMISLCHAYGRLLDPKVGGALLKVAYAAEERFAAIANGSLAVPEEDGTWVASPSAARLGAFYCAAAELEYPSYAVCVGPDAIQSTGLLRARAPYRLIAPAAGQVRPDMQHLKPGVYLVRLGQIRGPYTVEKAAAKMGPTLDLLK